MTDIRLEDHDNAENNGHNATDAIRLGTGGRRNTGSSSNENGLETNNRNSLPPHASSSPSPEGPKATIDILYENQRGAFFCGIPLFSSASLLNFDPPAWVTADYKPSPVNITNAQVPDPSWEWEWKTWYADMSHDVDEEGWQYSSWLFKGFSWHGSHPWWHSFVRRRRWIRRRVKRTHKHHLQKDDTLLLNRKDNGSIGTSVVPSTFKFGRSVQVAHPEEEEGIDDEIKDVLALMRALKKAAIDREKIVIVKQFLVQGGEELHYLVEEIPEIMSMLVFQNSRRQLLEVIMEEINEAEQHRRDHEERKEAEGDIEKRRIDNLLHAREVAEAECKKLEYWSDGRFAEAFSSHDNSGRSSRSHVHSDCVVKKD